MWLHIVVRLIPRSGRYEVSAIFAISTAITPEHGMSLPVMGAPFVSAGAAAFP